MIGDLQFWQCRYCLGTGRVIFAGKVNDCHECDGTGNALVDGPRKAHERRIREIEEAQP